jgi:VIT1/CCC1 family predicted Fe2+/Mn2+ transporter
MRFKGSDKESPEIPYKYGVSVHPVPVSVCLGVAVLSVLSYLIAKHQKTSVAGAILHHVSVAVGVMVVSYFVGHWITRAFAV